MTIDPNKVDTYAADNPTNTRSECLGYWAHAAEFAGMPEWTRSPLPNVAAARAVTPGIIPGYPPAGRPAFLWFGTDIGWWDGSAAHWTDGDGWGRLGVLTIPQRLTALQQLHGVSDTYLGYSENLYGTPIAEPATGSTPTNTTTESEDDDMSAADVQQITNTTSTQIQRGTRYRGYRNSKTGELFAINWNLPSGDPAKIAYFHDGDGQVASWYKGELIGDQPGQFVSTDGPGELTQTELEGLAHGKDSAFTK